MLLHAAVCWWHLLMIHKGHAKCREPLWPIQTAVRTPYESMYSTMVGMVLLQTEILCKPFTPYDRSLNLAVTWLPQGRFQAIHPKQPRHARTMLRSYDAKQCSFRNHKAESITGVETNPRKVALKQKVPVPLKQTKTRERPKSLVMRYIPKWWMVCWTKIKI